MSTESALEIEKFAPQCAGSAGCRVLVQVQPPPTSPAFSQIPLASSPNQSDELITARTGRQKTAQMTTFTDRGRGSRAAVMAGIVVVARAAPPSHRGARYASANTQLPPRAVAFVFHRRSAARHYCAWQRARRAQMTTDGDCGPPRRAGLAAEPPRRGTPGAASLPLAFRRRSAAPNYCACRGRGARGATTRSPLKARDGDKTVKVGL